VSKDDDRWNFHYEALVLYGDQNGTCNVPQKISFRIDDGQEVSLGRWLNTQRKEFQKGTLIRERQKKLQKLVDDGMLKWSHREPKQKKAPSEEAGDNDCTETLFGDSGYGNSNVLSQSSIRSPQRSRYNTQSSRGGPQNTLQVRSSPRRIVRNPYAGIGQFAEDTLENHSLVSQSNASLPSHATATSRRSQHTYSTLHTHNSHRTQQTQKTHFTQATQHTQHTQSTNQSNYSGVGELQGDIVYEDGSNPGIFNWAGSAFLEYWGKSDSESDSDYDPDEDDFPELTATTNIKDLRASMIAKSKLP
jgi:hypothetical protein